MNGLIGIARSYLCDQLRRVGLGSLHREILHEVSRYVRRKVQMEALVLALSAILRRSIARTRCPCFSDAACIARIACVRSNSCTSAMARIDALSAATKYNAGTSGMGSRSCVSDLRIDRSIASEYSHRNHQATNAEAAAYRCSVTPCCLSSPTRSNGEMMSEQR